MKTVIKMAWRNIWRNKRRTLITTASIFFALLFALIMRSFQLGSYGDMYKKMIESYSGYIQVQHKNFWDDRTLDNGFFLTPEVEKLIFKDDNVKGIIPHLETGALASNKTKTKGVLLIGIDPVKEDKLSSISKKIVFLRFTKSAISKIEKENIDPGVLEIIKTLENKSYSNYASLQIALEIKDEKIFNKILPIIEKNASYPGEHLKTNGNGILLGDMLANYLKINVADTLVLIGQGYHGVSAADMFPVKGIVHFPNPQLNSMAVFMSIKQCQNFLSAENLTTSAILKLDDIDDSEVTRTKDQLNNFFVNTDYIAKDWKEMNKAMIQALESDNQGGKIMLGILYLIIAFGVFGTVLMMTNERKKEFGVLISIGMQRTRLAIVLGVEMFYIGLLGIISSIIVSIPIILYGVSNPVHLKGDEAKMLEGYGFDPVLKFANIGDYFFWQSLIVVIIVIIATYYPARKILRLNEVQAIRT